MLNWKEIWEKKGNENTTDPRVMDGFSNTDLDPEKVANAIIDTLQIKPTDRVLEVGCGAGMLAQYLKCNYMGVDYSQNLVRRHIELFGNHVVVGEANKLNFEDKSFDKVFAYSVFHYFPSHEYAKQALQEMKRVAKTAVFIGDLPFDSHSQEHLLYSKDFFPDWVLSEGYYNPLRYNAFVWLNGKNA